MKLKFNSENFKLLKRIAKLAIPIRGLFFFTLFTTILQSVLSAFQPMLYQQTIDEFIVKRDLPGLFWFCALIFGLLLLQAILGFVNSYFSESIGQNVIQRMRNYTYEHLLRLRVQFFDKTPVGTAVTRTISDIETVSELFAAGFITIIGDLIQIIVILFLMFYVNWKMALITLSVLPLLIYAANKFRKGVRDSFQEVRNEVSRLNAFLQEHITGMQIVQLFGKQKRELNKFNEINSAHRDANIRSIFYYAVFFPVVEFIVALSFALLVWYGSRGILLNTVTEGQIVAFIMFINLFFRPVRAIADRFNNIQMGMIAADRIFKLIDSKENHESYGQIIPTEIKGKIEFKNVHFSYDGENKILENINFTLEAGQTMAIVGHTGSGKTSIIQLLNRFYIPQHGQIFIDDIEISEYSLPLLREKIGTVLQDVFLFSGSIGENIQMSNPKIDLEKIISAAKEIGAYDFIQQLPGKFEFNVMERGLLLSLGQRQLISFIRALAYNPSIFVLDEATSSIDTQTEVLIQAAIHKLLQNRTGIVIAHRFSTIKLVNQILVLDKGKIVEFGNHETLMDNKGTYYNLYLNAMQKME